MSKCFGRDLDGMLNPLGWGQRKVVAGACARGLFWVLQRIFDFSL